MEKPLTDAYKNEKLIRPIRANKMIKGNKPKVLANIIGRKFKFLRVLRKWQSIMVILKKIKQR